MSIGSTVSEWTKGRLGGGRRRRTGSDGSRARAARDAPLRRPLRSRRLLRRPAGVWCGASRGPSRQVTGAGRGGDNRGRRQSAPPPNGTCVCRGQTAGGTGEPCSGAPGASVTSLYRYFCHAVPRRSGLVSSGHDGRGPLGGRGTRGVGVVGQVREEEPQRRKGERLEALQDVHALVSLASSAGVWVPGGARGVGPLNGGTSPGTRRRSARTSVTLSRPRPQSCLPGGGWCPGVVRSEAGVPGRARSGASGRGRVGLGVRGRGRGGTGPSRQGPWLATAGACECPAGRRGARGGGRADGQGGAPSPGAYRGPGTAWSTPAPGRRSPDGRGSRSTDACICDTQVAGGP